MLLVFRYVDRTIEYEDQDFLDYIDVANEEDIKETLIEKDLTDYSATYFVLKSEEHLYVKDLYRNFNAKFLYDENKLELADFIMCLDDYCLDTDGDYLLYEEKYNNEYL